VKDTLIIVNPASGGGKTGKGWPRIAAQLREVGLDFDVAMTSCRGEAMELSRLAVGEGRPLVVAAGGDGTMNEVANGFFADGEPVPGNSRFGVLPMGTGGDFRRTLGLPIDVSEAGAVLVAGRSRRLDAGRVTCTLPDGGRVVRHYINIADAGIGGDVSERVNHGRRLINGEVTFLLASIAALLRWRNKPMRVVIDDQEPRDVVAQQVVVANCEYFGGGMRVAPGAHPDDGLLDVVVIGDVSTWENIRGLGEIRDGKHLEKENPKVSHTLARRVEVSSSERVCLDVDGEVPGLLPAVFEVQPGALDVVCP
jgi:YegS/Rv2252/BmrU family lipid kinase